MKKLLILLVFIGSQAFAQLSDAQLVELQEFLFYSEGKKVGKGICFNLVDHALMLSSPNWKTRSDKKFVYGKKIKVKNGGDNLQTGDVILFKSYINEHGIKVPSHVSIVVGRHNETNEIIIAHQNVGVKSLKESKVVFWALTDLLSVAPPAKKVEFYRPY